MKTRLLAIATVLLFVAAVAGTSFAMMPLMSGEGHTCPMGMKHGTPQHSCRHHQAPMPCCPMPTSNPTPAPSPAECMTRGECCQLSEDRTRPVNNDGRFQSERESKEDAAAKLNSAKNPSPTHRRTWVNAGLRYEKPVFDQKTDLRI